jgi:hypothetical protein
MRQSYRHTQTGYVTVISIGVAALLCVVGAALESWDPVMLGAGVLVAVIGILFSTLTVEVRDGDLRFRFGPGPVGRRWPLADIAKVEVVKNRWYWGWGIRLTPFGWLYNVSGLHAVQITLRSGRRYRIGSDEPEALRAAIAQGAHVAPRSEQDRAPHQQT